MGVPKEAISVDLIIDIDPWLWFEIASSCFFKGLEKKIAMKKLLTNYGVLFQKSKDEDWSDHPKNDQITSANSGVSKAKKSHCDQILHILENLDTIKVNNMQVITNNIIFCVRNQIFIK